MTAPTLIDHFLGAVPNELAELGYGLEETSSLIAFQEHRRPAKAETEIRRALALVDRAIRRWAADAVGDFGQTTMGEWLAQLPEATSPEASGHLAGLIRPVRASVDGWARQTVLAARLAADAASRITDDLINADNSAELTEVAEYAAGSLAAWALQTRQEDLGVEEAVEAAETLAVLR